MEPRFGHDFSQVRVHPEAQTAAAAVHAKAFTVGKDIVFGPGQYSPMDQAGKLLLAHELAHVIQQQSEPVLGRHVQCQPTPLKDPSKTPTYRDCTEATTLSGNPNKELETSRVFARDLVDAAIGALGKNNESELYRTALARHFITPNFEDRKAIIRSYRRIDDYLKPKNFRCAASKNDVDECLKNPEAGIITAFTNMPVELSDTVICASFWTENLPCRAITLIHEAAHGRGIGNDEPHPPFRGSANYPHLAAAPGIGVTTAARRDNPDAYAYFAAHIGRETDTKCLGTHTVEHEMIEIQGTSPKPLEK